VALGSRRGGANFIKSPSEAWGNWDLHRKIPIWGAYFSAHSVSNQRKILNRRLSRGFKPDVVLESRLTFDAKGGKEVVLYHAPGLLPASPKDLS